MAEPSIAELADAARAQFTDPERNKVIGRAAIPPRFEAYHFTLSLCSHKVRTALIEKGVSYLSHDINIFPPQMENYNPDYVRLRLHGGKGKKLVDGYSGRSSVETEGFDPAVVPTLYDMERETVVADSKAILKYLDREIPGGTTLFPPKFAREIERQLDIVDRTPHVAILYGAAPDGDFRPEPLRHSMPGIHDYKIMKLMENRALAAGTPELTSAYDQKIRKEAAARAFVRNDDMMRAAIREMANIIEALDRDLEHHEQWFCGRDYTAADIVWAVSLFRLKWIGMGFLWEGGRGHAAKPRVAGYAKRVIERPSFMQSVVHWPGHFPTEYVMDYYPEAHADGAEHETARIAAAGSTRDAKLDNLTQLVMDSFAGTPKARNRQVLEALTRHLHAFLADVEPTPEEWRTAIGFLTRTGQLSAGGQPEFALLSDVLGATTHIALNAHRHAPGATTSATVTPSTEARSQICENGQTVPGTLGGQPLCVLAQVLNTDGEPLAGARVETWSTPRNGAFDSGHVATRGQFRSDGDGRVWFRSVVPKSEPVADFGTAGQILKNANRNTTRPAHINFQIEAPGYEPLTTMLFIDGDPYLDADPAFGAQSALMVALKDGSGQRMPDGTALEQGTALVAYEFKLARKNAAR